MLPFSYYSGTCSEDIHPRMSSETFVRNIFVAFNYCLSLTPQALALKTFIQECLQRQLFWRVLLPSAITFPLLLRLLLQRHSSKNVFVDACGYCLLWRGHESSGVTFLLLLKLSLRRYASKNTFGQVCSGDFWCYLSLTPQALALKTFIQEYLYEMFALEMSGVLRCYLTPLALNLKTFIQ